MALISVLLLVLVIGIQYTLENCRKLVQIIRGNKHDENHQDTASSTRLQARVDRQAVENVTAQLKQSTQSTHEQLGQVLQSMQQLQLNVASQLTELKQVFDQYAVMQQQQQNSKGGTNSNDKED